MAHFGAAAAGGEDDGKGEGGGNGATNGKPEVTEKSVTKVMERLADADACGDVATVLTRDSLELAEVEMVHLEFGRCRRISWSYRLFLICPCMTILASKASSRALSGW